MCARLSFARCVEKRLKLLFREKLYIVGRKTPSREKKEGAGGERWYKGKPVWFLRFLLFTMDQGDVGGNEG